jgi:hypothetical protein
LYCTWIVQYCFRGSDQFERYCVFIDALMKLLLLGCSLPDLSWDEHVAAVAAACWGWCSTICLAFVVDCRGIRKTHVYCSLTLMPTQINLCNQAEWMPPTERRNRSVIVLNLVWIRSHRLYASGLLLCFARPSLFFVALASCLCKFIFNTPPYILSPYLLWSTITFNIGMFLAFSGTRPLAWPKLPPRGGCRATWFVRSYIFQQQGRYLGGDNTSVGDHVERFVLILKSWIGLTGRASVVFQANACCKYFSLSYLFKITAPQEAWTRQSVISATARGLDPPVRFVGGSACIVGCSLKAIQERKRDREWWTFKKKGSRAEFEK